MPLPMSPVRPTRPNEMINQKHARKTDEGQLSDSSPRPVRQKPDVGLEPNNRPIACAMQRLMGHQSKPPASV